MDGWRNQIGRLLDFRGDDFYVKVDAVSRVTFLHLFESNHRIWFEFSVCKVVAKWILFSKCVHIDWYRHAIVPLKSHGTLLRWLHSSSILKIWTKVDSFDMQERTTAQQILGTRKDVRIFLRSWKRPTAFVVCSLCQCTFQSMCFIAFSQRKNIQCTILSKAK